MQNRFQSKVRRWTDSPLCTEPFDVVIMDNSTGIMYCSPRTLSEDDASVFTIDLTNLSEHFIEHILPQWGKDGNKETFESIEEFK